MEVHKIKRAAALVAMGALVVFMALPGVSYAGQPKDGSSSTEDNDGNDGNTPNNISDDGDNKHPSGKDRSVEKGGSGNQGNSKSDPDDDGRGPDRSNGGPDKANGSGGMDKADQDGNNGCGNDDDFEDDNEGWCGKHPKKESDNDSKSRSKKVDRCKKDMKGGGKSGNHKRKTCDYDGETPASGDTDKAATSDADPTDDAEVASTGADADGSIVLGAVVGKAKGNGPNAIAPAVAGRDETQGAALPFTGASLMVFIVAAMSLLAAGVILMKRRTNN